jgi:hypothetical protein
VLFKNCRDNIKHESCYVEIFCLQALLSSLDWASVKVDLKMLAKTTISHCIVPFFFKIRPLCVYQSNSQIIK